MTDTGHVPGEGMPGYGGGEAGPRTEGRPDSAGPGWGAEPGAAYAYLDQPEGQDEDDDLLLMPGLQGSWSESVPLRTQQPAPRSVPRQPMPLMSDALLEEDPPVPQAGGLPAQAPGPAPALGAFPAEPPAGGPGPVAPGAGAPLPGAPGGTPAHGVPAQPVPPAAHIPAPAGPVPAPEPVAQPRRPLRGGPAGGDGAAPAPVSVVRSLADRGPQHSAPPPVSVDYLGAVPVPVPQQTRGETPPPAPAPQAPAPVPAPALPVPPAGGEAPAADAAAPGVPAPRVPVSDAPAPEAAPPDAAATGAPVADAPVPGLPAEVPAADAPAPAAGAAPIEAAAPAAVAPEPVVPAPAEPVHGTEPEAQPAPVAQEAAAQGVPAEAVGVPVDGTPVDGAEGSGAQEQDAPRPAAPALPEPGAEQAAPEAAVPAEPVPAEPVPSDQAPADAPSAQDAPAAPAPEPAAEPDPAAAAQQPAQDAPAALPPAAADPAPVGQAAPEEPGAAPEPEAAPAAEQPGEPVPAAPQEAQAAVAAAPVPAADDTVVLHPVPVQAPASRMDAFLSDAEPQPAAPAAPEQPAAPAPEPAAGTPAPTGQPEQDQAAAPEAPAPGTEAPGAEAPEAEAPVPAASDPMPVEAAAPEAAAPEAAASDPAALDSAAPDTAVAEAAAPEAAAPEPTTDAAPADERTAAESPAPVPPAAEAPQPTDAPQHEQDGPADVPQQAQPEAERQTTGPAPEPAAPEGPEPDGGTPAAPAAEEPAGPAAEQPAPEQPAGEHETGEQEAGEHETAEQETGEQEAEAPEPAAAAAGQEPKDPPAQGYDPSIRDAVHKVMRERRDIRNGFRQDPIPHEVLIRVLEAAHTAPSVGHSQPWDFVVIRSPETRQKMHELATRQRSAYEASLPKARAKQFKELKVEAILDTPVNIVVTADPTRGGRHTLGRHTQPQMAPYSSALAVENLWLAARAEGLGVGWVSFFDEREMVRELGLPEHLEVVAYLCVGYVDEFPDEPELLQAGWSKRRPLSWVVHEEEYGRRALPGEAPRSLLDETLRGIRPLDAKALGEAWERQKRMTKPAGALGMLEIISAQLCGLSRQCPPPVPEPAAVAVFAGDHGVHAQGVTAWPQEVTAQMVMNFLGGGAVVNAFANQVGAEVCVVDVGVAADLPAATGLLPRKVRPGTGDITTGPAMTRDEALRAVEVGVETARDLVAAGNKALLTGEMGIANTTVSAALIAVYTGADPAEVTGRGTGANDEVHARKVDVVRRALELHRPDPADPIGVLAAVGGLEHAAMVGLMLGAASLRTPVILDGVSAGAAALVARAVAPEVLAACIAGHRSAEPGHVAALTKLGLRPLIDLDLRLGEGTGALLALPVVQSAARAMHEVATFDSAGVTEKS